MKINNLPSAALLKLQDQNHQVYIRDEEYGWLPATFLERDETMHDRVKVQVCIPRDWLKTTVSRSKDYSLLNKCKKWVAQEDVVILPASSRTSDQAAQVRDVLQLETLHEATLLYLLKERHSSKHYYTRMGSILLSFNPLRDADDSLELQLAYAKSFVWQCTSMPTRCNANF
jgi:myosin heavy subunit